MDEAGPWISVRKTKRTEKKLIQKPPQRQVLVPELPMEILIASESDNSNDLVSNISDVMSHDSLISTQTDMGVISIESAVTSIESDVTSIESAVTSIESAVTSI